MSLCHEICNVLNTLLYDLYASFTTIMLFVLKSSKLDFIFAHTASSICASVVHTFGSPVCSHQPVQIKTTFIQDFDASVITGVNICPKIPEEVF